MTRRPVFYSFHFDNDVMRVQQIRNIGSIEGNPPANPNEWEQIKRSGEQAVKNWIDDNLKYKQCVIVLIGEDTANREWVQYEIEKAWNENRPIFGIYIHNIKCPRSGVSKQGINPFSKFTLNDGKQSLSDIVQCYDPPSHNAYNYIANNINTWIEDAIRQRKK
jgi:hypothetical protein